MHTLRRRLSWALIFLIISAGLFSLDTVLAVDIATNALKGERVVMDDANSYNQHCLAVLLGDIPDAYHLGWIRISGKGVPVDTALAVWWFRLAAKHGDTHSQRILEDLLPDVQPKEDMLCPLRRGNPNRATIEAWINVLGQIYGLDASLLIAIVEVESRFNPQAQSPKNARGLMQLMPATARRFEVGDIWDPFENLVGGITYLRWLMDHYDGDLNLSLAAYNAGEHAVDHYGGVPPYKETRDYVKTISQMYSRAIQ